MFGYPHSETTRAGVVVKNSSKSANDAIINLVSSFPLLLAIIGAGRGRGGGRPGWTFQGRHLRRKFGILAFALQCVSVSLYNTGEMYLFLGVTDGRTTRGLGPSAPNLGVLRSKFDVITRMGRGRGPSAPQFWRLSYNIKFIYAYTLCH